MAQKIDNTKKKPRYAIQMDARGRFVIPAEFRRRLNLNQGDILELFLEPDRSIRLARLPSDQ